MRLHWRELLKASSGYGRGFEVCQQLPRSSVEAACVFLHLYTFQVDNKFLPGQRREGNF
jgi:hypothetical protein